MFLGYNFCWVTEKSVYVNGCTTCLMHLPRHRPFDAMPSSHSQQDPRRSLCLCNTHPCSPSRTHYDLPLPSFMCSNTRTSIDNLWIFHGFCMVTLRQTMDIYASRVVKTFAFEPSGQLHRVLGSTKDIVKQNI